MQKTKCGFVALVGRPNVGKSTLLNRLLGEKIAITSRKPQTTRHRIVGVHSGEENQILFVDTPGLHQVAKRELNKQLNRTASSVIKDVDVILFMVSGLRWNDDDEWILEKIKKANVPVILVLNKSDRVPNKSELLPQVERLNEKFAFTEIVAISAMTGKNVDVLVPTVEKLLPESPFLYPTDLKSDQTDRLWVTEVIREKLMRCLGQEIPYAIGVEIEEWKREEKILRIAAVIWIEKEGQKQIVIGKGGDVLKRVGQKAREDMEKYLDIKVFLQLWVKVKTSWTDDVRVIKRMGYWFDD